MALRNYFQSVDRFQELLETPLSQVDPETLFSEWGFCFEFKFKDFKDGTHCSVCPLYPFECSQDPDECFQIKNTLSKILQAIEDEDEKAYTLAVEAMLRKVEEAKPLFKIEELPNQMGLDDEDPGFLD